jgi:hypothetical protein
MEQMDIAYNLACNYPHKRDNYIDLNYVIVVSVSSNIRQNMIIAPENRRTQTKTL